MNDPTAASAATASAAPAAASAPASPQRQQLIETLARESFGFDASGADPERNCWLVLHRHVHGVLPSEYDIREVPEDLYLAVLARRRELGAQP